MRIVIVLVLIAWTCVSSAQSVVEGRELLHSGYTSLDDIEYIPATGEFFASRPLLNSVGRIDLLTGAYTPLVTGGVLGMALGLGSTTLWVGDFSQGTVREVDLTTGATLRSVSGLAHPIEILPLPGDLLLVGSMLTPNIQTGPAAVYGVTFDPAGIAAPTVQLLAQGITGGLDLAVTPSGRLFVASLGSSTLDEIVIPGGQVVPFLGPLVQGTDLIVDPQGRIYGCTLVSQEVVRFDPGAVPPTWENITAIVTSTPGPGLEDMAFDENGQILVATNTGEIYRIRVQGEIVQRGLALSTFPFWIDLDIPGFAGSGYKLVASLGTTPGIPIPGLGATLPLSVDSLFQLSLAEVAPVFTGFSGTLDAQGRATATVLVPMFPPWMIYDVYVGGVVFQGSTIRHVPDVIAIRIFS